MENVYSYLKWRGDLDLSAAAFNETDSLILALISYVDFDGIVPGIETEDRITLKEASDMYHRVHKNTDSSSVNSFWDRYHLLLKEAANTPRFGEILIGKYVNRIDMQKEKQFSASTIEEISQVAHLRPEYFCRFFKKHMGCTYLEYLNTIRLANIYQDLLLTDYPISQLLELHGFTNYKLFRRMFHDHFHDTPRVIRKNYRQVPR